MISQKQINEWKKEHGRVFRHILEDKEVYFRSMTAGEIIAMGDNITQKDMIKMAHSCILNEVDLKFAGSWVQVITQVADMSKMEDGEDLKLRALQGRIKVKENLYLGMIAQLCRIFPYTPDQLLNKNLDQLLDLVSMAEIASGQNIITTGDEKIAAPTPGHTTTEANKWSKPETDAQANNAANDLSEAMAKHGVLTKTFKQGKQEDNLTDLQRQMKELSDTDF